jgi:hypothetical protein
MAITVTTTTNINQISKTAVIPELSCRESMGACRREFIRAVTLALKIQESILVENQHPQ